MKYNEIVFVNNGDNSFFARFIINRNEINHSIVERNQSGTFSHLFLGGGSPLFISLEIN